MSEKESTVEGFRKVIHCGENVERIRITVYKKKTMFKKEQIDQLEFRKGYYPMRIILEDSNVWGKGRI